VLRRGEPPRRPLGSLRPAQPPSAAIAASSHSEVHGEHLEGHPDARVRIHPERRHEVVGILDAPSAERVLPEWQDPRPGDVIPIGRSGGWPVYSVDGERALVLRIEEGGVLVTQSWASSRSTRRRRAS
jgi:hypothetical protein